MVEYVNMIMRNEDMQGQEEKFGTWKASLEAALYEAENRRMTWAEAKKYRVEMWMHDTETDIMELYEVMPFIRDWKVKVKLGFGEWKDFRATEETSRIKARTAKDADGNVMASFNMDDLTDEAEFLVYPVNEYGEKVWYAKGEKFYKKDLE